MGLEDIVSSVIASRVVSCVSILVLALGKLNNTGFISKH